MDFEARFIILEVFQTLEKILFINFLLAAVSSNVFLSQFLRNLFNREYAIFKRKYLELPDLIRATDCIINDTSKIGFSTYNEFEETISVVIQKSFSEIEARYVSLAEGIDLLILSNYFLAGLENGQFVLAPNIGTIRGYIELLKKIFKREGIYPEVRIIAGYALDDTLLSWLMLDHSFSLYQEYANCTKELAQLIEKNLPEILKKNGSVSNYRGSAVTYDDAALKLLTAAKIAKELWRFKNRERIH